MDTYEREGASLLRDLAPGNPAAGAEALRALVAAATICLHIHYDRCERWPLQRWRAIRYVDRHEHVAAGQLLDALTQLEEAGR